MEFPEKERIDGVFKYFGEFAGMAKIVVSHVAKVLQLHLYTYFSSSSSGKD